jgi:predicted short-subunit dehydrogenase-like oxidoreductase (DUF2520 family)
MVADPRCASVAVPPGARAALPRGGTYAGPFVAALLAEAVTIWSRLGIPENDALAALLCRSRAGSLDAIEHSGLPRAMAGSVARGDVMTLERHLAALGGFDPALRDFYLPPGAADGAAGPRSRQSSTPRARLAFASCWREPWLREDY